MLMPKRVKYRKYQSGVVRGIATRGNRVVFGDFGLMSLEIGVIDARILEACRLFATRFLGVAASFYIKVFPHKSYTAKPQEVGMGGGKGEPEYWAAIVRPGTIMFEVGGVSEDIARKCFNLLAHKLSVKTKMVSRSNF
ncbi:MAG: 50S ribosomal protein L16 [Planctomycetes bacterium]|nr:50S ribosomal protein L16 [Planctomycetota bacterium]